MTSTSFNSARYSHQAWTIVQKQIEALLGVSMEPALLQHCYIDNHCYKQQRLFVRSFLCKLMTDNKTVSLLVEVVFSSVVSVLDARKGWIKTSAQFRLFHQCNSDYFHVLQMQWNRYCQFMTQFNPNLFTCISMCAMNKTHTGV